MTCDGLDPEVVVPIQREDNTLPPAPSDARTPFRPRSPSGGARQKRPARRAARANMSRTTFSAMLSFTYIRTPQHRTTS